MTLADLVQQVGLEVRCGRGSLSRVVRGGYASDLLSDVIAHGREGDVWVTLQAHQNVVAVAIMKDLAGIILVHGRQPEEETREKADSEGVPILVSRLTAFDLVGKLYELGVRGATAQTAGQRTPGGVESALPKRP